MVVVFDVDINNGAELLEVASLLTKKELEEFLIAVEEMKGSEVKSELKSALRKYHETVKNNKVFRGNIGSTRHRRALSDSFRVITNQGRFNGQ